MKTRIATSPAPGHSFPRVALGATILLGVMFVIALLLAAGTRARAGVDAVRVGLITDGKEEERAKSNSRGGTSHLGRRRHTPS
jgi:hypothetical protein